MIEEHSIILTLAVKQTTFELERRTASGLYRQKRGCGNATWGKLLGHINHTFNAETQLMLASWLKMIIKWILNQVKFLTKNEVNR